MIMHAHTVSHRHSENRNALQQLTAGEGIKVGGHYQTLSLITH